MEKFINELLAKFGGAAKELVYLSVTPGIGLEIIQIDPTIKSIKNYGFRPLEYSESRREIEDYGEFGIAVDELIKELKINPKCNVILNIPTVYIGKMELALLLNDESITEALVSDAEQSYLFKRCEPVICWVDAPTTASSETRRVFYGAVQKTAIDKFKSIFSGMGITLSGIEISIISTLRALSYSGLTEAQMVDNMPWNLMIVNQTGYTILAMSGKNIVDSYEEPIPLKTYEAEEVYEVIGESAQLALMGLPANYLYIVSETDMVSAELLASKMHVECKTEFFENNSFRKKDILPVSLNVLQENISKISLEAVGIGVSRFAPYPIKLEFTGAKEVEASSAGDATLTFVINGREVTLTEASLKMITLAVAGAIAVPLVALMLILPSFEKKDQAQLDQINGEIQQIDGEIKKLNDQASNTGFVAATEIEQVLKNNRKKLMAYSALGSSVPRDLWLTYFMTKNDGKIDIKGSAESVEDIYKFYKNMKDSLIDPQLKLQSLEMISSLDTAVEYGGVNYEFELTNMSGAELSESGGGSPGQQNAGTPAGPTQPAQAGGDDKKKFTEILPKVNMPNGQ